MDGLSSGPIPLGKRKNRNRIEIGASILQVASEGARKTRIMYGANLSYRQLKRYLQLLTTRGLLAGNGPNAGYKTTHRGITYLRQYTDYETSKTLSERKGTVLKGLLGT